MSYAKKLENENWVKYSGLTLTTPDYHFPRAIFICINSEMVNWDLPHEDTTHLLYSDLHEVFSYIELKITGRSYRDNGRHGYSIKAKFRICNPGVAPEDRNWVDCYLQKNNNFNY